MRKNLDTSRAGMIVFLGVLLGALWLLMAFGAYHEAQRQKYIVSVHPGSVNYGTHSTAVVPMVSVPTHRSSVPMISGNTVRSYAYSGHATMPGTSSGNSNFKLHTISSTHHSIGGGGSGGGGGMSGGSTGSSKGISYSGSFAVPTLALASPMSSTASEESFVLRNRRRVIDNGDGTYTGDYDGEYYNGLYWNEKEEAWQDTPPVGTVKEGVDGYYYEWDGTTWVRKGQIEDLGTPIGDAPWLWMLLLLAAYALFLGRKVKSERVNE